MTDRIEKFGLQVDAELAQFIEEQVLPGTGVDGAVFWQGFSALAHDYAPQNAALLAKRAEIQAQVDAWHKQHAGQQVDLEAQKAFLTEIGYLVPEGEDFQVETANTDPEIACTPGPQLGVPITKAR
jgi:malate synthase